MNELKQKIFMQLKALENKIKSDEKLEELAKAQLEIINKQLKSNLEGGPESLDQQVLLNSLNKTSIEFESKYPEFSLHLNNIARLLSSVGI